MPISVTCGACKKQFSVPDHYAGKTGKCTQCGAPILAPSAPSFGSDDQLGSFEGSPPPPQQQVVKTGLSLGSTIAGYKLQKRLGADKTSSVFLAQGPKGPVALKVLPPEITAKSPNAAKRFLRESRSLFGLDNRNVVSILDAGEELGTLYLAMELFSGRTVRDLMAERGGKVPPAEALDVTLQVARGLDFFNSQKLVHRNLKPEHVLVGGDGQVKIVGLGLVKSEEPGDDAAPLTMKGVAVGTPAYMSPEQGRGDPELDIRTDLWSLGITLYEMLAGEVPWFHKQPLRLFSMVENDPIPPLREKNPTVSPTVELVIEKLLRKKREDRYQTPLEVVADLEAIASGNLVQGKPPSFTAVASPAASSAKRRTTGAAPVAAAPAGASSPTDALVRKLAIGLAVLGLAVLGLGVTVVVLLMKKS
jgi:serine/threonine-protein kinase